MYAVSNRLSFETMRTCSFSAESEGKVQRRRLIFRSAERGAEHVVVDLKREMYADYVYVKGVYNLHFFFLRFSLVTTNIKRLFVFPETD